MATYSRAVEAGQVSPQGSPREIQFARFQTNLSSELERPPRTIKPLKTPHQFRKRETTAQKWYNTLRRENANAQAWEAVSATTKLRGDAPESPLLDARRLREAAQKERGHRPPTKTPRVDAPYSWTLAKPGTRPSNKDWVQAAASKARVMVPPLDPAATATFALARREDKNTTRLPEAKAAVAELWNHAALQWAERARTLPAAQHSFLQAQQAYTTDESQRNRGSNVAPRQTFAVQASRPLAADGTTYQDLGVSAPRPGLQRRACPRSSLGHPPHPLHPSRTSSGRGAAPEEVRAPARSHTTSAEGVACGKPADRGEWQKDVTKVEDGGKEQGQQRSRAEGRAGTGHQQANKQVVEWLNRFVRPGACMANCILTCWACMPEHDALSSQGREWCAHYVRMYSMPCMPWVCCRQTRVHVHAGLSCRCRCCPRWRTTL